MPTIDVHGVTISYSDTGVPAGLPDAPTIVFGHGLLFGGWMFRSQITALRERYRCVAVDWRGQGDTPAAADGYDMDTLTGDAVALIRELGVAPVHWVGLSMGGFVGQRIAARHGELLRSLTLLDTSAGAEEQSKVREYKQLALLLCLFGIRPILGKVSSHMFGPAFLADTASVATIDEWVGRLSRNKRAAIRKAVLGVVSRASVEREITGITVPTLVVVGADDRATPVEKSEHIAARIPGAQLQIVANCGHSSSLEQPATITSLLAKFLATADRP
ncbi:MULTISPECIES: alpha/beta fold hydrolase [Protofrankia]|uniref:Alpha/beta hydrolase n=1 Tax=Protofrankia coriariae TaxID=1562887 RepID=A0ABR5F6M2_9ACTN|nr:MULTISPECIES: alpha/beta fold hydrolase [Protofrankia]KLL12371.1 alpha/beta hydrolase [Protofrankia coriariae]ONH37316.1 alpha/beta hydrolase [Protofrankia sp. BMG5.30]